MRLTITRLKHRKVEAAFQWHTLLKKCEEQQDTTCSADFAWRQQIIERQIQLYDCSHSRRAERTTMLQQSLHDTKIRPEEKKLEPSNFVTGNTAL